VVNGRMGRERHLPPDVRAPVFPQTLIIKAVDRRDLPRLVVSADQSYPIRVPDFEA
jgi:hypothetical protein